MPELAPPPPLLTGGASCVVRKFSPFLQCLARVALYLWESWT